MFFKDLLGNLLSTVSRQTVHYHRPRFCRSHQFIIDLISLECLLADLLLFFLTHGSPCICDDNVCIFHCLDRIIYQCKCVIASCEIQHFFRRTVIIRSCDRYLHIRFQTAYDQGVRHVVAVADVTHLEPFQYAVFLTDRHQISQYLARMAEISQTVDDRDRTVFCQILHFFLLVGTDHDAVQITGEYACGILYRLTASDL